jgi:hypothetical protein
MRRSAQEDGGQAWMPFGGKTSKTSPVMHRRGARNELAIVRPVPSVSTRIGRFGAFTGE